MSAPTEWVGPDVLTYSVEVVDSLKLNRIALLDTFKLNSTTSTASRSPSFFTWYPLASKIKWVAPTSIGNARKVMIRINVFTNGSDNKPFFRHDFTGKTESKLDINSRWWNDFMSSADAAKVYSGAPQCGLTIATVLGGISLYAVPTTGNVEVFDIEGNSKWSGATPDNGSPQTIALGLGRYIVVRSVSGEPKCTRLIVITN